MRLDPPDLTRPLVTKARIAVRCFLLAGLSHSVLLVVSSALAQEPAPPSELAPVRGSVVEDRAAKKLIEAGDARYDADEMPKAVEIWQSVVERYPKSRVRYEAHMRLGNYFLDRDRAYDRARVHFEAVAAEDNRDEEQRAAATLKMGVCFYHARNFGKSFQVLRDVIEKYPVSPQVNEAYYFIGLGHFQLGHYSRAISSLEKVGTTLSGEEGKIEKLEAGKRLFVKIEDADLAVLEPGQALEVECAATSGDKEKVKCYPVGRNVRLVLGSVPTQLGRPDPGNGTLEVKGDDKVTVTYTDTHTAEKVLDRKTAREVTVVGNAIVQITDGAFSETLRGVVLGKAVNVQIADADRDLADGSDKIEAVVEVYRPKTDAELEAEATAAAAKLEAGGGKDPASTEAAPKIDPLKRIDSVKLTFVEAVVERDVSKTASAAKSEVETKPTPSDDSVHSGVFRAVISLDRADAVIAGDDKLQALPGDFVRVVYLDERHRGEGVAQRQSQARCLEGNIGGVRVSRAVISDEELRIQTQLKTASALTNIGKRYKEFGLKENAGSKFEQALAVCEDVVNDAHKLGGRILEESYVQLWHIYFEMDRLDLAAAMCQRLQKEFPASGFVDDALLQLADVARKQNDHNRAIGIYSRLVGMETSQLRGEAQFGIAACYEQMSAAAQGAAATQMKDRAFQEYKKVFDQFPESGRVGEAVAKMAEHYYQQKDYSRAIDTFESVLANHPDAKFLDVILFNYGRCLYRLDRKSEAQRRFDQLIGDFPESPLAADAKKISEALAKGN